MSSPSSARLTRHSVAVDEDIGRQADAGGHFLLREHRRQAVGDMSGLHTLDRCDAGAHRRLTGQVHAAVLIAVQPRGALSGGAGQQQQILRAVAVHVGQLKRTVIGLEQHARRAAVVKVAHRQRARSVAGQLPCDHDAAAAVRGDGRIFDRLDRGSLGLDRAGAPIVIPVFLVDIYLEVVARRRGRAAEEHYGLLRAVTVQIDELYGRTVLPCGRGGIGNARCQKLFELGLQRLIIAGRLGRREQLVAGRHRAACKQQKAHQHGQYTNRFHCLLPVLVRKSKFARGNAHVLSIAQALPLRMPIQIKYSTNSTYPVFLFPDFLITVQKKRSAN